MKSNTIFIASSLILILILITSCSYIPNTESNIKKQITLANYCETVDDCAPVESKCPFGCYINVNKNEQARISSIVNDFESKCVYSCIACEQVLCQNNKCVMQCDGKVYSN